MRAPRLHVAGPLAGRSEVALDTAAAHHVQRVLRLRDGDAIVLFDGRGGEYAARLGKVDGQPGALIEAHRPENREAPIAVTLWQAVCRGGRMDYVIEKATELGVQRIVPLLSRRVVVRLDDARGRQRAAHWQKIAVSACEQCGMNLVPEVTAPVALSEALHREALSAGSALLLDPQADRALADLGPWPASLTLLVGPEGGFEPVELQMLGQAGFRPVALGPRTLRSDTAGLAAASMIAALAARPPRGGET